jgi:glycosyltransferase involved in cell wall biosynthesis
VAANKLESWIRFVGVENNIFEFMSALDVLILPSIRDEDLPNVISEAMSLGKPVIASRLAGTPEQVIDGKTGFLVNPNDTDGMGNAINKLWNNRELLCLMGHNGLERYCDYFASDVAISNYIHLYKKLINGKV